MMKKMLIVLGVFAGILLSVYIGISIYFNSHYYWNTIINNIDCGGKKPEYVIDRCSKMADDYLLTITDREQNKFYLRGLDFDYKYVPLGEEEAILESQNPFKWPLCILNSYTYDLSASVSFDSAKFETALSSLDIFSENYIKAPENAYINISGDGYEVVPEVMGNTPIWDKIYPLVNASVESELDSLSLGDECYLSPEIYASDSVITDTAIKIDNYANATIHYEIDNADENFSREMILKSLSIDSDWNVNIDTSIITDFVQHLASTYNTYADVREFQTTKGDTIKIGGGDYGWVISKRNEEAQILADLAAGQPVSREPVYEQRAIQSGLDDIGNTYVEIDYTNQHLWYYKDGALITETDIVSGNLTRHNGSVDGVFKIVYKQRDATLVGEDYESKVDYFMPFAYNIGIHDAKWRSSFGKNIYKTSGSHGCINVPAEIAQTIYENIESGTPVIAYYREKVELTNNAAKISNAYSYVEKDDKNDKN